MLHTLIRVTEALTGWTRVTVMETERAIVLRHGQIETILTAGEHRLMRRGLELEYHNLSDARVHTALERALFRERPDLVEAHLTELTPQPDEVLVLRRDGRVRDVLLHGMRALLWSDAGPWEVERVTFDDTMTVPLPLLRELIRVGQTADVYTTEIREGHVGLMMVDGALRGQLEPGVHGQWRLGRLAQVRVVDLRQRTHEVTGQEILTKDRVTIRVNLTAVFRVVDAERALTAVSNYEEALHRALQLAFRRTLGAVTLDRLLAEKVTIDAEAAQAVRAEMADLGLELGEIALKDVILPGEMRDILNRVVAAEKEAEANVIRRREETNATRALLNTAKVMEQNPVMLRLKELEALETIAGKVDQLTVHNGTEGLMTDVVRLRDR